MRELDVIVRMKIRDGRLDGFTNHVAEIVRATREKDTRTLRCDWFVDGTGTVAEVHETFRDENALVEHKMNTSAATSVLFEEFASDHDANLYGEVSRAFVDLLRERGASPSTYALVRAARLADRSAARPLEVIARLEVRPGELDGFLTRATELVRVTEELDTKTLRYDWFLSDDGTHCEVHEAYVGPDGLVEHNRHVLEARTVMLKDHTSAHRMSTYGPISPELRELGSRHAGGIQEFSFLHGLGSIPLVGAQ